jgi:hypothetical protein
MPRYWIGVTSDREYKKGTKESWWCLPYDAKQGDIILFYCPRSVSTTRQGIFAEATVTTSPESKNKQNYLCSGYGTYFSKGSLGYVDVDIKKIFDIKLTAKEMKEDPMLFTQPFVRRNFQGTAFRRASARAFFFS